ncbi:DegT/DnrJ/EryC1/StrS family aminotransferase [Desulfitobacterium sp.]|uniref:DegT/DnrJ/EryC1/StrS family aminotransferase n=1 Tax=Desulfitobacterium sp. TaxID=49981 RepID=UPI002C6C75E1|nr:DegT/DnrJ/EryC1/StrS family aminotransferase [Desulfitobacterium sp.]HVJ47840.1 DegT/DnrJ/EryC1/StrS family aminotransferase [Desulfitobacterium sp.]
MRKKIGVGHASIGDLEKKYVNMALEAGRLSQGEFVNKFEKEFASLHGQKYGIACNSGTSALHAALEALKEKYNWPIGSEVIVPTITFIATSNACIHAGLTPIFVDVDSVSYNIDPALIEEKITEKTAAIIPVHAFGQPCEMDKIISIAKKDNLKIIEDCAEAHFAIYKGRPVGSFSDISGSSTYVAHTITTGIGGIITTNDRELAEICRSLIAHGRACTCEKCIASNPDQVCKLRMTTDLDKRFMMVRMGYSYRIGELEGALGIAQLENRDYIIGTRRKNAAYLTERLQILQEYLQLPSFPSYIDHSFMMYPIVIKKNAPFSRRDMTEYLESLNIESRPMLPLLNQPIYKEIFGDIEKDYPVAEWINNNGFYVGCHHGLEKEELDYIVDSLIKFIETKVGKIATGSTG